MNRLPLILLFAALCTLCLGQMCAPSADTLPPPAGNDGDDGADGDNGTDGDDAAAPDESDDQDAPGDTGDTDEGDVSGDGDDPIDGDDPTAPPPDTPVDDGSNNDDGDDGSDDEGDNGTEPPPGGGAGGGGGGTGGGGEEPITGPCSGVDFTGLWTDGDRLFEITQDGYTITSRFVQPFVCDHEDGQGTTSTTDEDFTATLAGDCTIAGVITVCRFGCTPDADDCTLDENGIASVEFEGEVSELGDIISIDFTDPATNDVFSLLYTLEP